VARRRDGRAARLTARTTGALGKPLQPCSSARGLGPELNANHRVELPAPRAQPRKLTLALGHRVHGLPLASPLRGPCGILAAFPREQQSTERTEVPLGIRRQRLRPKG
jgi:hypothetical protein